MDDFEDRGTRRAHGGPYTAKHPVPTVRGYREHRAELKRREDETEDIPASDQAEADSQQPSDSKTKRAYDSLKAIAKDEDKPEDGHTPYPHANRNADGPPDKSQSQFQPGFQGGDHDDNHSAKEESNDDDDGSHKHKKHDEKKQTATETVAGSIDPKEKRKTMKKAKRSGNGREVTDPVTHLPVVIHDMTDRDLHACPENEPGAGEQVETLTGGECEKKDEHQLEEERRTGERGLKGMRGLFPGPRVGEVKGDMVAAFQEAFLVAVGCFALFGVAVVGGMSMLMRHESSGGWLGGHETARRPWLTVGLMLAVLTAVAGAGLYGAHGWLSQKVDNILEDEVWDAARQQEIERNDSEIELPESAAWLNSMLASVWRLINPDLFSALVDTLEDVMQASLPKIVRMVSVDDIGQGSEAFRILGIRWLPTGAAGQSVDSNGKLRPAEDNDRKVAGQGQQDEQSPNKGDEQSGQDQEVQEGMEAEEGDFVNLELAFAYRARTSGKSIKSKAKNAHLYLKFYLPGNIAVPVWVELRGIVGIMRLRLQLTPDPPFFQLCTLTFLGQPRADLSCVPLSKHSLNLMNVPLISSFVQSSIDAALAEYVAPKSLTLDLKDMLMGDDFKKDTLARGVMLVHIKRARDFKEGDGGLGPLKKGSSDSYVSVSWGKFGKPVACTRIIKEEQEPNWDEWAMVLVTSDEINAEETLRLQLWDSDKHTADDDLGRVEVNLKEIMHGSRTKNRMCDREDELRADDLDEKMPGTLTWSVGYFSKAHIQQCQLNKQTFEPSIRSIDGIKERVSEDARSKLREAMASRDVSDELKQQEAQDGKELEDMMIISAPPPEEYPSGILGIQIHNITGLEVAKLNRSRSGQGEDREDESEQSGELPDSYCTVILNHKKIYRTRTKPKNAKPFFNAGTERFVKDWRTAEVIVSVRDSREGENDPLLGVVYLPLRRVFDSRSQIMGTYPLAGGIGYGRARISMVWRSVELKMPKELTGWDYGTLEVIGAIKAVDQLPEKLKGCKLKLRTKTNKAKMYSHQEEGVWKPKHEDENVFLGVTKRYASPVVIHFCDSSFMSEDNPDLAVLWLTGIPDEEEQTVKVKVWKGGKHQLRRAKSCTDYRGLDEGEEPLGEIELKVRFWRGLSGYHKAYAGKEKKGDVKGVMEVLDTVNDEKMGEDSEESSSLHSWESSSDSDSDTDSDSEDEFGLPKRGSSQEEINKRKMLRKAGDDSSSDDGDNEGPVKTVKSFPSKIKNRASSLLDGKGGDEDDGRRGVVSQVQDYKRNHKQLHRKHRGVMQWKATRTLDWMVDKARQSKGKVEGLGHHGEKEQGIETEV